MGRPARSQATLPGVPMREELAYLAGLIDKAGGIVTTRSGAVRFQIRCAPEVREWLVTRFGGYVSGDHWCLSTQADVLYVATRVRGYTVRCSTALDAVVARLQKRADAR